MEREEERDREGGKGRGERKKNTAKEKDNREYLRETQANQ